MALTIQVDRRQVLAELGGQGFRFALTGGIVAVVFLSATSLLAEVIGLGFVAALTVGFGLAIATHFTLQRLFVWRNPASYALPVHHQLVRYLVVAGIQYGLTATAVATLPHALGTSSELVYLP